MMLGSVIHLSYFGVATVEVGVVGGPYGNQGMWLWTLVEMSAALERKGPQGIHYYTHFVVNEVCSPGTRELSFFSFFFFCFWKAASLCL